MGTSRTGSALPELIVPRHSVQVCPRESSRSTGIDRDHCAEERVHCFELLALAHAVREGNDVLEPREEQATADLVRGLPQDGTPI